MSESQRERARNWVNGNTAAAVAVVCGTALVPGAAAVILLSQEAIMAYHIGSIYKSEFSQQDAAALAGEIGLAAVAGKVLALEAAILAGPAAFLIKPAIAAGIVKLLGEAIIAYCEEKWG
ncbi:hypothetical protein [Microcoleus sp.]|uniref:hypothetical protein n=1 Tax=Microcoleus sp. TaxID=44472 RepID=UPI003593B8D4